VGRKGQCRGKQEKAEVDGYVMQGKWAWLLMVLQDRK
jgi:hypothetical protein